MLFEEWLNASFPNKGNNSHTTYSKMDMNTAYIAGGYFKSDEENMEEEKEEVIVTKEKNGKAKIASLVAQSVAALWVAFWCGNKFYKQGGEIEVLDVIFSGFAIAACFSPVYFNMILDKIKKIKFGE